MYLIIITLVFPGEGLKPLILNYVIQIPAEGLYWVNMVSAVLDNATLAAAEIGLAFSVQQIKSTVLGHVIAGGMLIPGNIPNIITAGKPEITGKEWARRELLLGHFFSLLRVWRQEGTRGRVHDSFKGTAMLSFLKNKNRTSFKNFLMNSKKGAKNIAIQCREPIFLLIRWIP